MLSQNTNALGIIFPNSYDNTVPELVTERAMASIPFAGRYRMVDFVLSSMANCGISNVSIVVRKNYHSLMDHLGTGREWDMARRHGTPDGVVLRYVSCFLTGGNCTKRFLRKTAS